MRRLSSSFLIDLMSESTCFSFFQRLSISSVFSRRSAMSFSIVLTRVPALPRPGLPDFPALPAGRLPFVSLISASASLRRASFSTWSRIILRCASSSTGGLFSSEMRKDDDASSIRSMALSGRKRSGMYLEESCTAAISESSVMRTPWKSSYFSLSPRSIAMASSIAGSITYTGWKRR